MKILKWLLKKVQKMNAVSEKPVSKKPVEVEKAVAAQDLPEAPYGPKISSITDAGIEFYWKKVEKADGYEIFRSYAADGGFEKIGENTKNKGVYTDSSFDPKKKKISYQARSFMKQPDGSMVYSEMTKPVTAVFREELKIERDTTYMYDGTSRKIKALYGWGEAADAKWQSGNEDIVAMEEDGTIHALKTGEAFIICSSEELGKTAAAKVVVNRSALEPLDTGKRRYVYNSDKQLWENPEAESNNDAVIMMVGDLMCGSAQMKKQFTKEQGWNFNDSFEYVKATTAESDLAVGNLETLMASGWPYMQDEAYIDNMNNCNSPSRYLDAVLYGGFDAVTMSNNHNCDGGTRALLETIDEVALRNIPYTGVFRNADEKRYVIVDVKGIRVGFLAYMSRHTSFNGKDATWTPEEKAALLNIFSKAKAVEDIAKCKADGAEYVIAYMHWGKKNYKSITKEQQKEAQQVADAGADYIVGANPHMVQVYDEILAEDGRTVPCFYSTGNFQAYMNQIPGNRDSVMVRIRLNKDEQGKVVLAENKYIPYHVYKEINGHYLTPMVVTTKTDHGVTVPFRKKHFDRILEAVGDQVEVYGYVKPVKKAKSAVAKVEPKEVPVSKKAEEERTLLEKLKKREDAAIRKMKKERYIQAVMDNTGWDKAYAKAQMDAAKAKIGCSYYVYAYFEYYNMTEEEQKAAYAKRKKKQEKKAVARQAKRERCLTETLAATGWTREYAEKHLDEAMARTGCDPEEYRQYRFWSLDNKTQESFFLLSHTDKIRARFNVDLKMNRLIGNKSAANIHFAKYIDRRWCTNRGTSFEEFKQTFAECKKLFYKPVASYGGHGARPFDLNEENMNAVYDEIMELPEGVVEEFVVQHPRLSEMSPRILNTVRLTSISSDGPVDETGRHFVIPYAMLKMGGATGYVDNLREGGVGAAIDLETGKLCTDAVDVGLNTHTHHPVTGMQIKGFEVPYFAEAKAMIQRIVEENNMKGYLAWDVAITDRGPMLIEINSRPSPTLLELPFYNTPRRGNKHLIEKYM